MKLIYTPESITHLHLLSVLVTEVKRRELGKAAPIRVLDAGFGNGHLDTFLHVNLADIFPELRFEIYGYDVGDYSFQAADVFLDMLVWCRDHCPEVPWHDRMKLIRPDQPWPFQNDFFDFVISNQVLEHVNDHSYFFHEHYRVLKSKGAGVHLFPLKHYVYEGHLLLPFVHRISDWNFLKFYIKLLSKVGLGKYSKEGPWSIEEFSEMHADFMTFYVNYISKGELFKIVKNAQMRPSLQYTRDFYLHKIRNLFVDSQVIELRWGQTSGFSYWLLNNILKYISSITLFVEKENTYRHN
jgi:ubiquinone/menaquinone biosynthesis C-methylase UbiE